METTHQRALNKFGEAKQEGKLIEEMAELMQAILKRWNGREHNVSEEIADVQIVLDQIKILHPDWKTWEQIKLKRLEDML